MSVRKILDDTCSLVMHDWEVRSLLLQDTDRKSIGNLFRFLFFFFIPIRFQFLSEKSLEKFNEITLPNVRYIGTFSVNLARLHLPRSAGHYLATM